MRLAGLIHGAQALGTDLHLHCGAIQRQRGLLDVRLKHTISLWRPTRPASRMFVADIAPKRRSFPTNLTFCHNRPTSSALAEQLQTVQDIAIRDYTISAT